MHEPPSWHPQEPACLAAQSEIAWEDLMPRAATGNQNLNVDRWGPKRPRCAEC